MESITDTIDSITHQFLSRSVQIKQLNTNSLINLPLSRIRFILSIEEANNLRKQVIQDALHIQQQQQQNDTEQSLVIPDNSSAVDHLSHTTANTQPSIQIDESTGLGVWQSTVIEEDQEETNNNYDNTQNRNKKRQRIEDYHINPSKAIDLYNEEKEKEKIKHKNQIGLIDNNKQFSNIDTDTYGATDTLSLHAPFGAQIYKGIKIDDDNNDQPITHTHTSSTTFTAGNTNEGNKEQTENTHAGDTGATAIPQFKKRNINTNARIRKRED